jgi:acetamidase/formamidase
VTTPDERLADDDANVHYSRDRDHERVLAVDPGTVVRFECRDAAARRPPRRGARARPA